MNARIATTSDRPRGLARRVLAAPLCLALAAAAPAMPDDAPDPREVREAQVLHVERSGVAGGPALLLIPGLSCGADVWSGTVEALEGEYDLHIVTLAGFAGQPALELDQPFLPRVRDALAAYIEQHDLQRPALVGHSLGGFLAYSVASAYPERVGAVVAVDGVPFFSALQDPSATPAAAGPLAAQLRAMFTGLSQDRFRQQNELTLRTMIRDPAEVARIASSSGNSDPATVGCAIEELMTTDLRAELARIRVPILQLGAVGALPGEQQRVDRLERYREQLSAAPQAVLLEASTLHFVMLDGPQWFAAQLREFLEGALTLEATELSAGEAAR